MLRPSVPNRFVVDVNALKARGSNHRSTVGFESLGSPNTSGRVVDKLPSESGSFDCVTVNGCPLRALKLPANSHPPRNLEAKPSWKYDFPLPKGNSQIPFITRRCR